MTEQSQRCLVYYGEILEGFQAPEVKRNLSQLFKLDESGIERVFSGTRVVLKQVLSEAESPRYLAHLAKLGAKAYAESLIPLAKPDVTAAYGISAPPQTLPSPQAPLPVQEEMCCPKCGERQPKRTLCRACAVDMPRFFAAQSAAKEQEQNSRMTQVPEAGNRSETRTPISSTSAAPILSLSLEGRLGRISYVIGTCVLSALMLPIIWWALQRGQLAIFGIAMLAALIYGVRLAVVRCHDLDLAGGWVFLSVLPFIGWLGSLALMVWPGTRGENRFGEKPHTGPMLIFVISLILFTASFAFTSKKIWALSNQYQASSETGDVSENALPGDLPPPGTFDPAKNQVLIYSSAADADCKCSNLIPGLRAMGIEPTIKVLQEGSITPDDIEMMSKVSKAGLDTSRIKIPVVDANGKILTGPTVEDVLPYLKR